ERNRDLLRRGAVLVDETDASEEVRALVYLEHAVQDARTDKGGNRRVISRQMQFVEIDATGETKTAGYAPYLDYRPLRDEEKTLAEAVADQPWLKNDLESKVLAYAVENIVRSHFDEVKQRKEDLVQRSLVAVK